MSARSELKQLIQQGVDKQVKSEQEMRAIVDEYDRTVTWSAFVDEWRRLSDNDKASVIRQMYTDAVVLQSKVKK